MTVCDWCGESWEVSEGGIITIHEKAPLEEYMDDEIYNFCCYKCVSKWVGL
jgi:hypothetical protein